MKLSDQPGIKMRVPPLTFALIACFAIPLGAAKSARAVDIVASATLGAADQSYGVATIEIPLATPVVGEELTPLRITSDSGRLLYSVGDDVEVPITRASDLPVPEPGNGRLLNRLGSLLREITNPNAPDSQTVSRRSRFLFRGEAPLQITVEDERGVIGSYQLYPVEDPQAFPNDLFAWWNAYIDQSKRQMDKGDYPPWVESYLIAMLSGRTGNGLPTWFLEDTPKDDPLWTTLKTLFGAEQIRRQVFRRTAAGLNDENGPANFDRSATTEPLPAGPAWVKATLPKVDEAVETEPIASLVPPECFYIRFGSFENYLWFLDLSIEYGGDLGRMVTLRGIENTATQRFEDQLGLELTQITRMLGPTVIEDQAVIGTDLFTNSGASMGVIMKSKNAFLLRSSMNGDRSKKANADPAVTLKDIKINGQTVSLMSSPDNRMRSYMAEHQGYFLMTNSEYLVRRFLEVGKSGQSLASSDAFRLSRALVPLQRNDTIFAYFSPEMLQGLVSPKYLIELRRRSSADADTSLVHLARLAAYSEGVRGPGNAPLGIDQLIDEGFLPVSFGRRSDGSGVVTLGESVIDTLRGARGTFLPIADIDIQSVTPQEFEWYTRIANEYTERFPQMDPIMLAIRRDEVPSDPTLEQISVHAEIAPLTPEKYGKWAQQLGPPTNVVVRPAPDDIVSLQAHVASAQLGPPTHLFAGIKDTFPPDPDDFEGIIQIYRSLKSLPAYLGAWPQPGALDRLPLGLGVGRPIGPGMSRLLGGLYRYTGGGFSVLSFQQEVLNASLPFLEAIEVENAATVRGQMGSLMGSQLEGWVNNQLYQRAAQSSRAGAEFLNLLSGQLGVQPDDALETAKLVLGDALQCSLGGQYEYQKDSGRWVSSAWNGDAPFEDPPANYVAPLLNWFRGGEVTMIQYSDRLVADAVLTLKRNK